MVEKRGAVTAEIMQREGLRDSSLTAKRTNGGMSALLATLTSLAKKRPSIPAIVDSSSRTFLSLHIEREIFLQIEIYRKSVLFLEAWYDELRARLREN